MTKLIFIGGAPSVGKSTVARRLLVRLDHAAWLNGDDLWRMHPFIVNQDTTSMVEGNIQSVLGSFVAAGFSYVLFTWVLHDQSIIDKLLNGITDTAFQFSLFTLVCDEETLKSRLTSDALRCTDTALALQRLQQTLTLASRKIDTTGQTPEVIVEEIMGLILA